MGLKAAPKNWAYWDDRLDKEFYRDFYYDEDLNLCERQRGHGVDIAVAPRRVAPAPRRARRGSASRSSAKSGDSNDSDPDPERRLPPFQLYQLYDQAALASILCISKKTLQNLHSSAPWLLPPAVRIPGARGPRWTMESVQTWLDSRPAHTPKPAPQPKPQKKVGRPRIALVGKGGTA